MHFVLGEEVEHFVRFPQRTGLNYDAPFVIDNLVELLGGQAQQVADLWGVDLSTRCGANGTTSSMCPAYHDAPSFPRHLHAATVADDALWDALILPQWHSQSLLGPKIRSQNKPPISGLYVR